MVSVKEVAAHAGVSVGTVSNVLNRPDQVKAETVERVRAAIDALGYVPNAAARQLRAGRSRSLALLVLDVGNPFFTDVARGAEARAAREGMSVFLANSDDSTEREGLHLDVFEQQRVGGVLISPAGDDLARLAQMRAHGIPAVLVDREAGESGFSSVAVDDVAGGTLAARHLLETGRRRLAFVGGPLRIRQVADRFAGASAAVAQEPAATLRLCGADEMSLDEGKRVGEALAPLIREGRIDGIVAANDLLAIGIQRALLFADDPVRVPEDVALVGYDDIAYAASAVVPISSIRQPSALIGATAVELVLEAGEGRPARSVVFAPELVVRESSASAPA
ncbi:LacI family DNA-binding transcriptional regulator [Demequina sp. SYSU T00192]|uniref:LacI family DNA-binding transcriptional regulator n=1 Tax=Demequina litoralis TaxID=3051660 RepID=A0ABT8G6U1_9MICO|nr:LacI family DNA-binding transcriptional regulator [Demequina sp. SYSU T00192]MDN4474712.1 LacI family DNA-binding transcriptional regulator [Demequina sp. SYSU T00192]